jgi:hypothetical protein
MRNLLCLPVAGNGAETSGLGSGRAVMSQPMRLPVGVFWPEESAPDGYLTTQEEKAGAMQMVPVCGL